MTIDSKNLQLFHFNYCPYCIKVRAALKLMGIDIELKNIHESEAYLKELLQGGGKKQVPCLRIEQDGHIEWLYESDDIIHYLKKHLAG
ncbi:hypothetical protein A8L45_03090 [Veronia pacifica]|uniref:GST N-terminal domain-containing protein n=1 Tax=Veronia pacifica TaxID=1080227 RepID=A0A1C3EQU9_9GAMM|nr:hypothetical protein A8L45_03090 [Veronia pacifica]